MSWFLNCLSSTRYKLLPSPDPENHEEIWKASGAVFKGSFSVSDLFVLFAVLWRISLAEPVCV